MTGPDTNEPPPPEQPPEEQGPQTGREAVPEKERTETLRVFLEKHEGKIVEAAANKIKPGRLLKLALTIATKQPLLVHPKMDKLTVLRAVLDTASLGLDLSPGLGEAYLVPYWNKKASKYECQLIIGYRGLITLARRSDAIAGVDARPVFHGEKFEPHYGTKPFIDHIPDFDKPRTPDRLRAVYTVWHLADGGEQFDIMSKAEVDEIRKRSKAAESGPWVTDYIQMGLKSITRRSSKLVPMTIEAAEAIEADTQREFGDLEVETVAERAPIVVKSTGDRLAEAVGAKALPEGTAPAQPIPVKGSLDNMELVDRETGGPPAEVKEAKAAPDPGPQLSAHERELLRDRPMKLELWHKLMKKGDKRTEMDDVTLADVNGDYPEFQAEFGAQYHQLGE